jgi:hypothetical protein
MNDFLTRLTERLRPERLVLQPILPSRFEQVAVTEPFWRGPLDPFSVVDAEAGRNPAAARSNLDDRGTHLSLSIHSAPTVERQRQDPTARVIAETAKGDQETGKSFAQTERTLARREADEATFSAQKTPPPANTPPHGLGSTPPGERRMKLRMQEGVDRSMVREPSIVQEQSATARADHQSTRPEDENLRATRVPKPTRELSLTDKSPILVKEHESTPIEPRVEGQLLHEPKAAFPSSRFDPPPPEQGALRPLPANSTHQRVGGDSAAAFELKTFASPEIHVTIGRIEVRAIVTPPSGPRLQAPRAPQSSLDDYLRSRKEAAA